MSAEQLSDNQSEFTTGNIETNTRLFVNWFLPFICRKMGTTTYALRSKSRIKEIVQVRQASCFYLWKYTSLSFQSIAEEVGLTDHTTAMHHVSGYMDAALIYPACEEFHEEIEKQLSLAVKRGDILELTTLPKRSQEARI